MRHFQGIRYRAESKASKPGEYPNWTKRRSCLSVGLRQVRSSSFWIYNFLLQRVNHTIELTGLEPHTIHTHV